MAYDRQKTHHAMPSLFAPDALLPSGWARDVRLEWDETGTLTQVAPGAQRASSPRAAGPVLPGMPNVHSHAFQRAMAGLAERRGHPTDDFWTWREAMYDLVRRVEPEDVAAIAEHLYVEMLQHGYTAVAEFHYLHRDRGGERYANAAELPERIAAAARASGIALTFLPVLYAYGGFGGRALDDAQRRFGSDPAFILDVLRALAKRHGGEPLFRVGVAPHSVRAIDASMLREVVAEAHALDASMPVHMHLSEQAREVEECNAAHAATPFEWIERHVPVDARWSFVHATHITPAERARLAACGAAIVICPATEANLGDGIFDLPAWLALGGAWSIGGDSHVSVSPFEELRALEQSQRLRLRIRSVTASEEAPDVALNLWQGAALGGARALAQPVGVLREGNRADLVVLDCDAPAFEGLGAADALSVAMFAGSLGRVRDVFAGGRHLVRNGRHRRAEAAADAFRAALRRLRAHRHRQSRESKRSIGR
jgi:formimidoylglutamate deiminase